MVTSYSIVYMYYSFFIHLSINENLGCFHCKQCCGEHQGICVSFNYGFLRIYAQQWDCWVICQFYFQFFKDSPFCAPQQLHQFTFLPKMQKGSLFSTASPLFTACRFFDDGHSDQCKVIPHCSFDLNFSNNERGQASFHVFISHVYVFFGEMFVQVYCLLFDWVVFLILGYISCLYNLEINPLSVVSLAIIFSHSEGCVFTFLVSFAVQKLLSLIRSHLFLFLCLLVLEMD